MTAKILLMSEAFAKMLAEETMVCHFMKTSRDGAFMKGEDGRKKVLLKLPYRCANEDLPEK